MELDELKEQSSYWEERALKAEQRLLQQQKAQESLRTQAAQAESRVNILQAEVERLAALGGTRPSQVVASSELEERLKAAEERARLFENELREVHYKVADRMLRESPESWLTGFEFSLEQALPVQRAEQVLDQYYRMVAYAESLRQHAQKLDQVGRGLAQENHELQRSLATREAQVKPDLEMQRLAFEDPLTGLPNQQLAHRYLGQELQKAEQGQVTLAVIMLDIDRLRSINLSLGVDIGDLALIALAERLKLKLRAEEVLIRGKDDEFWVILSLPVSGPDGLQAVQQAAMGVAQRLSLDLQTPILAGAHQLMLNGCVGVAVSQGKEALRLVLERAQLACKKAKHEGQKRVQLYSPALEDSGRRRLQLATQLQQALEQEQFCLQFQPIFELSNGKIWGTEALLRWNHPQQGTLEPSQFIDIALETGLIVPLGEWVVREATKIASLLETLHLSINLSAQELMQADFVRRFTKLLELSHVTKPERLILEVNERELGAEAERIAGSLKELRRWNIQLAVDDFTFDSLSLRRVQELDVGHIKLDHLLVHNLANPLCEGLVRASVQVAGSLKCRIWAEGVESQEQLLKLKELGVQMVQGNFLCPPLPPGALRDRLKTMH